METTLRTENWTGFSAALSRALHSQGPSFLENGEWDEKPFQSQVRPWVFLVLGEGHDESTTRSDPLCSSADPLD